MPQLPHLVRIGNRGFNLQHMASWEFRPSVNPNQSNTLIVYLDTYRPGDDSIVGAGYEVFTGMHADALMAYLDDMGVDVLAPYTDDAPAVVGGRR